ncbi:sensor histidine kinase KdpD [Flavobacterium sp. H122]|uniref:sensor histidine kinase n=1 Tax=Flavobacterium sp. H122 TaxID=2529860 RepID=UPI0010AAC700|nr:HAMP domain-containing sensor histidine kinase [Flavobacterium sp. H122]
MKKNKLNILILLGLIAIVGILIAQLLWTKEAFQIQEKKFSQKVHIALLEVVKKLYQGTNREIPADQPVKKISNDYYIANVENDFAPDILEHYLKEEFTRFSINTDFEYAMYNCQSEEMVYGKYISMSDSKTEDKSIHFPKHKDLVYYFAIRFPTEKSFLLGSMKFWLVLTLMLLFILIIYVYSVYTLIQQKKYSELQRDFVNNMTHEFKTPLSSILLASNYLSKQNVITNDEKLNQYTQIIIQQGQKLNQHIERVLNVAKSDDTAFHLNIDSINLRAFLEELITNAKTRYDLLEINLTMDADYQLKADKFHLTNLCYNLIDNSVKYSENKPEITIVVSNQRDSLQIVFKDNGLGVDKKNIPFLFEKFYREKNQLSNETNGFGLGLFYAKKVIEAHHWQLEAQTNQPSGLSIHIKIPQKYYGKV